MIVTVGENTYLKAKINANKEMLNLISLVFQDAAEYQKNKNHDAIAQSYKTFSDEIYDALKNAGYYEEV